LNKKAGVAIATLPVRLSIPGGVLTFSGDYATINGRHHNSPLILRLSPSLPSPGFLIPVDEAYCLLLAQAISLAHVLGLRFSCQDGLKV